MIKFLLSTILFYALGSQSIAQSTATVTKFEQWVSIPSNSARVAEFEAELQRRNLSEIVPTYQLLRTALSWERCGAAPFALPSDKTTWEGAYASLEMIKTDILPLIGEIEIVSGYRNHDLNRCAGGSSGSVHRQFGAFDIFATGQITRSEMISKLCRYHAEKGRQKAMGLGIYQARKFHVDVGIKWYRRWGADYTSATSPCNSA